MKRWLAIFIGLFLAAGCAGNWADGLGLSVSADPADTLADTSAADDALAEAGLAAPVTARRRESLLPRCAECARRLTPPGETRGVTARRSTSALWLAPSWQFQQRCAASPRAPTAIG